VQWCRGSEVRPPWRTAGADTCSCPSARGAPSLTQRWCGLRSPLRASRSAPTANSLEKIVMPLTGNIKSLIWGYTDGWWSGTVEVNFAPRPATASVAMSQIIHEGRAALGIKSYDYRDTPGGPNKTVAFKHYWDWPPSVYKPLLTRVIFGIDLVGTTCRGGWTVDFWN
jgi:hypothetical protein